MKLSGMSAAFAIALLLGSSQTMVEAYDKYNVGGYWAEKGGDKEKALELWKKAVDLQENKPNPNGELPLNCDNVASVLADLNRYAEAEPYCAKAALWWEKLEIKQKQAGSTFCLARSQYKQGKYAEAEANFRKAMQLYSESKKSENSATNTLNWLGWTQLSQGHYADCIASTEEAISRRLKAGNKKNDGALASDYQLQARALNLLGKPAESETSLKKALAIYEELEDKQSEIAATLYELGYSYFLQKKYSDSETNYKKALEGYQKKSANSADVAATLNRLGNVYWVQRQYADAELFYSRAAAAYETTGKDYLPTLAAVYENLARTYLQNNKTASAEQTYRNCIVACEKSPNYNQIDLALKWEALAQVLSSQAKIAEAESIYSKSLSMLQAKLPADDARIANNTKALASLREKHGQPAIAAAAGAATSASTTPASTTPAAPAAPATPVTKAEPPKSPRIAPGNPGAVSEASSSIDEAARSDRPVRDKWALIVGIGSFKSTGIPKLKFAAQDARDFRDYLVKEAHFAPDHVRLLLDDKATRRRIMSEMGTRFLARVAKPDDLVIVFFSTHGSPSQLDPRGKNYLVTYDTEAEDLFATGVEMQDILEAVQERVLTSRALLIVDACHSGAIGQGGKGLKVVGNFDAETLVQGSGQLVLCSSSPDQQSWESDRYKNGIFTRKLIEALKKNGSKTKLGEAFDYLQSAVAAEAQEDHGMKQTPRLNGKWNGSELTVAAPAASPAPLPESVKKILEPDSAEPVKTAGGETTATPARAPHH